MKVIAYFMGMIQHVITHRRMNNVKRNDIMQVLLEIKNKEMKEDSLDQEDIGTKKKYLKSNISLLFVENIFRNLKIF